MNEKIIFKGALGDDLAARLDAPANPKSYVLFAHCFTCNKDLKPVDRIAKTLNEEGIALLRFDFTGLGSSGGDFSNTNFSSNVQDLIAAANFMRENYLAPQVMVGHSLGGTATLAAASQVPEVKAVATIGSPADTSHVQHNFSADVANIIKDGCAQVELAGRKFTIKKQFLDDIENQNMQEKIANLGRPLLIMHSVVDNVVKLDNAKKIYDRAKHPKSFVSLDNADHLLLKNQKDSIYVAKVLAAWVSRYI